MTESGLLAGLSEDESAEALERVQNLNKLFGLVQRVGPLLKSDRVPFFIQHLDQLIEAGDDPQAFVADTDEDAVQLLTAHNAKGLEFDTVYIVNLVEGRFPAQRRGDALPFPPELANDPGDPREDHEREERRLFYVALTRAKRRLVLTHARDYGGKRTAKMSRFLAEALDLPAPAKSRRKTTPEEAIAALRAGCRGTGGGGRGRRPGRIRCGSPTVRSTTCSHARCSYRFAHIVHVPVAGDPRAMYGIAMHHAIRVYFSHRLRGMPIALADVIAAFDGAWSGEGFHSREHEERRQREGHAALEHFVARRRARRKAAAGRRVRVPLRGRRRHRGRPLGPDRRDAGGHRARRLQDGRGA